MSGEPGTGGAPGPVPVRDVMQRQPEPEPAGEPQWEGDELSFEMDGAEWRVKTAGAGSMGTGTRGIARVVAVHFFREDEPEKPVREALLPAGSFPNLREPELRALFQRATPIVLDT